MVISFVLRETRDSLTGKNQELLQLNCDNVRLTEHAGLQDKDLRELRTQVRRLDVELQALRPILVITRAFRRAGPANN